MALSVITNGSKVHDYFRSTFFQKESNAFGETMDWKSYAEAAGSLGFSKKEKLMLPYLMDESVPVRKRGMICDGFSQDDARTAIRALHLSQVLSLKLHSGHLGRPEKLCVVGGGAKSPVIRQWIADVFNAEAYSIHSFDTAAPMGCAISGAATILGISYREAFNRFVTRDENLICKPRPEQTDTLNYLLDRYRKLENQYAY
jgi:sugar (pentulose or hexulose) kinase